MSELSEAQFHAQQLEIACLSRKCEELRSEIERLRVEVDVLMACRRGNQRCHECPDTECCDNMNEAARRATSPVEAEGGGG